MIATILTSVGAVNVFTSALSTRQRGVLIAEFRVGSAVSAPVISTMSMVMTLQKKIVGSDELWCDVQSWAIAVTEPMSGRHFKNETPEPGDFRLGCDASYGSGFCNAVLKAED